ncbi:hypothetical protein M422DRAFT_244933 [Sphaerobolus stellatus SS14]|nr:hypothetical protein M422DRAFT_244933 [Sphaerobolus stellatus SS14]
MVQRFTNWIKDGGVVVIGCGIRLLPNGEVPPFDESGWKDSVETTFLGQKVTSTYGSMDVWKKLLEKFGLRLVKIDVKDITLSGGGQQLTVRKSYLITRKSTDYTYIVKLESFDDPPLFAGDWGPYLPRN